MGARTVQEVTQLSQSVEEAFAGVKNAVDNANLSAKQISLNVKTASHGYQARR